MYNYASRAKHFILFTETTEPHKLNVLATVIKMSSIFVMHTILYHVNVRIGVERLRFNCRFLELMHPNYLIVCCSSISPYTVFENITCMLIIIYFVIKAKICSSTRAHSDVTWHGRNTQVNETRFNTVYNTRIIPSSTKLGDNIHNYRLRLKLSGGSFAETSTATYSHSYNFII